ncbi:hypothetical protein FZEAL_4918 [Fusarium zealandicum]|uniref:Uncharacterized protein n=1 Tax=Fusarium zealandicum TaxID=1053134 RepID=A0A8H4XLE7_9HYPO|nr:hypothetical protein FZEAL_4918 [Fusarium zealandicum]
MAPGSASAVSSVQGASKRKADASAPNARSDNNAQKRNKVHMARAIPAQAADAALKDGELDLQAFVAAHEFEIRCLEESMATSKAVGSSRAFQKVPRGLRRRTASHNPKRVPRRLRGRARKEMAEDNTPRVEARKRKPRTTRGRIRAETARRLGILAARKRKARLEKNKDGGDGDKELAVVGRKPRPKIRRNELNEPPKPKGRFRKRQLNKTWLPTHAWHAKRARMTDPLNPLWRFALPLTPNEKIYRPTHRAQGDRGAVIWEMSYMSTIGLYGNGAGIERVLKKLGVEQASCWNDKGRRWRMGTRTWTGFLSFYNWTLRNYRPKKQVCPCTILWNPGLSAEDATRESVFIRIHPSAFLELFGFLRGLIRDEKPRLYIEDLRFEIGSIDLTGPGSTEALLAVLNPYPSKDKGDTQHAELFRSLSGLTNAATLPAGSVLGFSLQDPRLHYPPRRLEAPDDSDSQLKLLEKIASWPAEENLQPYAIFSRDARHRASLLPSQKNINRRKSSNPPGAPLKPTSVDPPIPITLLVSRSGTGTQNQGTWTLLAPWKCIQPIWYSLVHYPLSSGGNPRFAGLNEARQVAFERGQPWFPGDFPATMAGAKWELEQRRKRKAAWEKRPKSKRTAWESLDLGGGRKGEVGDGFASDFEFLFELLDGPRVKKPVSTKGQTEDSMDIDKDESTEESEHEKNSRLYELHHVSKDFFNQLLVDIGPEAPEPPSRLACDCPTSQIPPSALLTVRITLLSRGVVTTCARIYTLPSHPVTILPSSEAEVPATIPPEPSSEASTLPPDLRAQWLARIPPSTASKGKASKGRDLESMKRQLALELVSKPAPYPLPPANQSDMGGHPLVPDAQDLIGFVTTGAFSLSEGHGVAIGSIHAELALYGVLDEPKEGRYCIVRNAGESVGWIAKWEAI